MQEHQRDSSEFNMAVSYLNRLNTLFYICDEASMNHEPFTWINTLMTLFRELSTEMEEKELEDKKIVSKKLFYDVNKYIESINATGRKEITPDLYWELHEFENFLRKVLKESGLQMKMKSDPRFALT